MCSCSTPFKLQVLEALQRGSRLAWHWMLFAPAVTVALKANDAPFVPAMIVMTSWATAFLAVLGYFYYRRYLLRQTLRESLVPQNEATALGNAIIWDHLITMANRVLSRQRRPDLYLLGFIPKRWAKYYGAAAVSLVGFGLIVSLLSRVLAVFGVFAVGGMLIVIGGSFSAYQIHGRTSHVISTEKLLTQLRSQRERWFYHHFKDSSVASWIGRDDPDSKTSSSAPGS